MILTEYDEQEARDWLRNEAREDGKREGKLEIACKMKRSGIPVNKIIELTGLTLDEIETL